jgi:hypothetical protein
MLKIEGKAFAFKYARLECRNKALRDMASKKRDTGLRVYLKTAIWKTKRRMEVMNSIADENTFDNRHSDVINRYNWLYSTMKHQRERVYRKIEKQTLDTLLEPLTIAVYAKEALTLNDDAKFILSPKKLNTFRLFHSEKEEIDPVATDKVGGQPTTAYAYRVMQMDLGMETRMKLNRKLEIVAQLQQHPSKANAVSHFLDISNQIKKSIRTMLPMLIETVVDAYNNPSANKEPLCSLKLAMDKWPSEVQFEMLQSSTSDVLEQIMDVDGEVKLFFRDFRREVVASLGLVKFASPVAKRSRAPPTKKFVERIQTHEVKSR